MISALQAVMRGGGVKDDWTRERVRRLVGLPIPSKPQTEMVMELTGVSFSVERVRVVLGPEVAEESDEEEAGQ